MDSKTMIIKGTLVVATNGTTKYSDVVKNRLAIKSENLPYQEFDKAYETSGSRMTPKWLKERTGYINLSSQYDIPVLLHGNEVTFSDLIDWELKSNAKVQVKINIKEGAIYPISIKVDTDGEKRNYFDDFE